jgi:hypothetical protein
MSFLSDQELAEMRAVCTSAMPDMATVQRKAGVDDGMGGESVTWPDLGTSACEVVREPAPGIVLEGEQPQSVAYWGVRLPYGTDVRAGDRIVVNGAVYEVSDVDGPSSHGLAVTANCKKRE